MTASTPARSHLGAVCLAAACILLGITLVLLAQLREVSTETVVRTPFDHAVGWGLLGVCVGLLATVVLGAVALRTPGARRGPALLGTLLAAAALFVLIVLMLFGSVMAQQY